jgi:hypothetical protein
MLEFGRRHVEEVRAAIQAGDGVHACDELVLGEQGFEVHHGTDRFQVVGVIGDEGVELAQAGHGIEAY